MSSFNSPNLYVDGKFVPGPVVGSTVWGLAEYAIHPRELEKLVRIGVVDFRDALYHSTALNYSWALLLCDPCADGISDALLESEGHHGARMGLRTTSEEQAKKMCFCCRAAEGGLPELMQAGTPVAELAPEQRYYYDEALFWSTSSGDDFGP